jgi:hypothetical protein
MLPAESGSLSRRFALGRRIREPRAQPCVESRAALTDALLAPRRRCGGRAPPALLGRRHAADPIVVRASRPGDRPTRSATRQRSQSSLPTRPRARRTSRPCGDAQRRSAESSPPCEPSLQVARGVAAPPTATCVSASKRSSRTPNSPQAATRCGPRLVITSESNDHQQNPGSWRAVGAWPHALEPASRHPCHPPPSTPSRTSVARFTLSAAPPRRAPRDLSIAGAPRPVDTRQAFVPSEHGRSRPSSPSAGIARKRRPQAHWLHRSAQLGTILIRKEDRGERGAGEFRDPPGRRATSRLHRPSGSRHRPRRGQVRRGECLHRPRSTAPTHLLSRRAGTSAF